MNKNVVKILLLSFFILLSCGQQKSLEELYGNWMAVHIFYNGEEILDNNFEETGWFPSYNKTKRFYIHKSNINLYLDRHEKPIIGEFDILQKDSLIFKLYNSTDKRFDGEYQVTIEKDTVMQEGIRTAYYFLTLESEDTKIMAVRNKAIFERQEN